MQYITQLSCDRVGIHKHYYSIRCILTKLKISSLVENVNVPMRIESNLKEQEYIGKIN